MKNEIRQNGHTVLASSSESAICVIFNNLVGRNFNGEEYRVYIETVAYAALGFSSGCIERYKNGHLVESGNIIVL